LFIHSLKSQVPYDEGHEIDSDELIDPGTAVEESEEIMADDEQEVPGPGNKKTTHVHQCDVCFKTFVSFKGLLKFRSDYLLNYLRLGLQQHAVG
jgi:hypothetical protein